MEIIDDTLLLILCLLYASYVLFAFIIMVNERLRHLKTNFVTNITDGFLTFVIIIVLIPYSFALLFVFLFFLIVLAPLILPIACLLVLMWHLWFNLKLNLSKGLQHLLFLPLIISPLLLFTLISFENTLYREQLDRWIHSAHYRWIVITLPIYIIALISLSRAVFNNVYLSTSSENYVMLITLVMMSVIHAYFIVPREETVLMCVIGLNYLFISFFIKQRNQLKPISAQHLCCFGQALSLYLFWPLLFKLTIPNT